MSRAMYVFSGAIIRQRRTDQQRPIAELALASGRSVESIRSYESGRTVPSAEVVAALAAALDLEPGDFYEVVEVAA